MKVYPPSMKARSAELREQGLGYQRIARELGVTRSSVYRWLNPAFTERQLANGRLLKERNRGRCLDCGKPTTGSRGPNKAPERCTVCYNKWHAVWTRDAIVEAIRLYAHRYGHPPGARDWNPSMARAQFRDDLAERFYEDACWPGAASVQSAFGRWNDAIKAAGFEPLQIGHKYVDLGLRS